MREDNWHEARVPDTSVQRFLCIVLFALLWGGVVKAGNRYSLRRYGVPAGDYSGITSLGGSRYAVVSDSDRGYGFSVWDIRLDSLTGALLQVTYEGYYGASGSLDRDQEGVAFCPERGTLFISGEEDQRILEHRVDGTLTGHELAVPAAYGKDRIQPNRGFEALCYDGQRQCFWTCTESPLRDATDTSQLTLLTFSSDLQPSHTYTYILDAPSFKVRGRGHYHGVVALAASPDGTLLVLEREARITRRYNGSRCRVKLYRYTPDDGKKDLVAQWNSRLHVFNVRFANYEGMCLGPVLADGRQTLLLISDSQSRVGKAFWHLKDYLRVQVL